MLIIEATQGQRAVPKVSHTAFQPSIYYELLSYLCYPYLCAMSFRWHFPTAALRRIPKRTC